MILAQSAGVLAGMALTNDLSIYDIEYGELKPELIEVGQVLEYSKSGHDIKL